MIPDYERAALAATETLIAHGISAAPVMAMPIIKQMPGVIALSFTEMADQHGLDRKTMIPMFGASNQDAITFVKDFKGELRYLVAYNQRLPYYMLQRALARELGHIVLRHDGSRPEAVRAEEALCFARYLLFPRALIHAIQEAGVSFTVESFGNITGCYGRCLAGLRKTPGAHIPREMNREIRVNFSAYIENYLDFYLFSRADDDSALADFGTFMENYEE